MALFQQLQCANWKEKMFNLKNSNLYYELNHKIYSVVWAFFLKAY